MSKRNVTFTKPDEPSFLKKLKADISYSEGPTVDTKRQDLGPAEDLSDGDEEAPTVVVLQEGDLTSEEVAAEEARISKEIEEAPADLSAGIKFKKPEKSTKTTKPDEKSVGDSKKKQVSSRHKQNKSLLSFDDEEEDDDC